MLGLHDFMGSWQVQRSIDDRHGQQHGGFHGTAWFVQSGPARLDYTEDGTIRFGNGPALKATRAYQWDIRPDLIDVQFADGRAFHSFTPQGKAEGSDHPCGADHYSVQYDFQEWPFWQAVWTVTGPRKDYTSTTHYRR